MNTIFDVMHKFCAFMFALAAAIVLDLPLKILSCILFLILGIITCLLYPIMKHVFFPEWVGTWYDYTKSWRPYIAYYIYRLWL